MVEMELERWWMRKRKRRRKKKNEEWRRIRGHCHRQLDKQQPPCDSSSSFSVFASSLSLSLSLPQWGGPLSYSLPPITTLPLSFLSSADVVNCPILKPLSFPFPSFLFYFSIFYFLFSTVSNLSVYLYCLFFLLPNFFSQQESYNFSNKYH